MRTPLRSSHVFLPLGTDRPLKRPTIVTHVLIGVNVLVFLVQVLLERFEPTLAAQMRAAVELRGDAMTPWALLTYQFVHGGFMHIAGNMLFLYIFGPNLEDRLGRWWYLLFYLIGGIVAGGAFALWTPHAAVIGASGSISAVTGAFLVFFPRTVIRVFIFFFIIGVVRIPAFWFIGFQIALNLFSQGFSASDGVAHLAHLAGYTYGFVVALSLLMSGLVPREPYDLFSLGRQAHRRRVFRELATHGHDPWSGSSPGHRGPRTTAAPDPKAEELSRQRTGISRLIAEGRLDDAASAYRALRHEYGRPALSRDGQLAVSNHYFRSGDYADAAESYEIFLAARKKDPEAPRVRLMLALVLARYLDRPADARPLLADLPQRLTDPDQSALAESLRAELGPAETHR